MEDTDVKLTKAGNPDKRTGKDGSSRKNASRAREKINTLVRAGKLQEDDLSDLEITIQKRAPVALKRPKPLPEPKRERSPSPVSEKYTALVNDLTALRRELTELRSVKVDAAPVPDPVQTIRRQILMRF